ncbi:MAG: phosphoenolpyruvate carboxykinase (GTP), partial [Patescibacteria group bacterium]
LHRSDPSDVARMENLTFVCHSNKETAGPNNNWMAPSEAKKKMTELSKGCMKGKTMYVLPFVMGNPKSPNCKLCVQVTDTTYVALSMRIMTKMGESARELIGDRADFIKGIHSIGDLNPERRFIMHFPEEGLVWSIGSGYGGNALLGKKCIALRLASCMGHKEGWLAEHMIIIGIPDPEGKVTYLAVALPSACGKTNLAMLRSSLPGYKVWTLGDDIAWLRIGEDGRLYGTNPEAGFFGVAPGTSEKTNPGMMETLKGDEFYPTLFTNVALDADKNEPWWEGLTEAPPQNLIDWRGNKFTGEGKAAHPNSRFTVSISQCKNLSHEATNPAGVPISGIIFGGRCRELIPIVCESFNWQHGVFMGASIGSETTSAAQGNVGVVRRDPMAMFPFCGYNMGNYFAHWLKLGARLKNPPKIFCVNWFRLDEKGKFLWPGFCENIRILKWIKERIRGEVSAKETPLGLMPQIEDLDLSGINVPHNNLEKLFSTTEPGWDSELSEIKNFFDKFGATMPCEMHEELEKLRKRLA